MIDISFPKPNHTAVKGIILAGGSMALACTP